MYNYYGIVLILLPFLHADMCNESSVKISGGALKGYCVTSSNGGGVAFQGIPLAKAPVGPLRYRAPVAAPSWNYQYNATYYRNACISNPQQTYKTAEGGPVYEDCLYINVFTPLTCLKQKNCSVMAVVHGGLLNFEYTGLFVPKIIVNNFANDKRQIVVVTLPYRLGHLGWFNPGPGRKTSADSNVGLRDVIFGLQWIQQEVEAFGGNPNRVTLLGHSSGASLVQLLTVSPMADGLYEQIVSMSGVLNTGGLIKQINKAGAQRMSRLLNCGGLDNNDDIEVAIECLRSRTSSEILEAQLDMFANYVEDIYGPWMDGPDGVLPAEEKELLARRNGKKLLIGTTSAEFRGSNPILDVHNNTIVQRLTEMCEWMVYGYGFDQPEVARRNCIAFHDTPEKVSLLTDSFYFYHHALNQVRSVDNKLKRGVYLYSSDYGGAGPAFNRFNPNVPYFGPKHSEDYIYIFGVHQVTEKMTVKDIEIQRIYSGMIANFVRFGDPSYGKLWRPWTKENNNAFHIDFDNNMKMPGDGPYYPEQDRFWRHDINNGGARHPLRQFPTNYSEFSSFFNDALVSHWLGVSTHKDKTRQIMEKWYKTWTDFILQLRTKEILKIRIENISGSSHAQVQLHSSWATSTQSYSNVVWAIPVVAVTIPIIAVITHKALIAVQRKNYEIIN